MKTTIDVKNRKEAAAIRLALTRPDVRAFVVIVGTLEALPSDRSRQRVLNYVVDKLDDERDRRATVNRRARETAVEDMAPRPDAVDAYGPNPHDL